MAAIESIKPTTIIGVSTVGGTFTRQVIEAMSRLNERPVILARPGIGLFRRALGKLGRVRKWRMLVSVRLLEIQEVLAARLQQTIDVEHVDARLGLLKAQPFFRRAGVTRVMQVKRERRQQLPSRCYGASGEQGSHRRK